MQQSTQLSYTYKVISIHDTLFTTTDHMVDPAGNAGNPLRRIPLFQALLQPSLPISSEPISVADITTQARHLGSSTTLLPEVIRVRSNSVRPHKRLRSRPLLRHAQMAACAHHRLRALSQRQRGDVLTRRVTLLSSSHISSSLTN